MGSWDWVAVMLLVAIVLVALGMTLIDWRPPWED